MSELLGAFGSDLKLGGVLLTLFLVFFGIGKFFWDYELRHNKDSLEKIKEILVHFKDIYIRPTLIKETTEWVENAYTEAIVATRDFLVDDHFNGQAVILKNDLVDAFSAFNRGQIFASLRKNDKVADFYFSVHGVAILEKLDLQYLKARDYKRIYDQKISSCRNVMYSTFLLAFVFLFSLVHILVEFPEILIHFFLYTAGVFLVLLIFSLAQFEVRRRNLIRLWEDLKTTGGIHA